MQNGCCFMAGPNITKGLARSREARGMCRNGNMLDMTGILFGLKVQTFIFKLVRSVNETNVSVFVALISAVFLALNG